MTTTLLIELEDTECLTLHDALYVAARYYRASETFSRDMAEKHAERIETLHARVQAGLRLHSFREEQTMGYDANGSPVL